MDGSSNSSDARKKSVLDNAKLICCCFLPNLNAEYLTKQENLVEVSKTMKGDLEEAFENAKKNLQELRYNNRIFFSYLGLLNNLSLSETHSDYQKLQDLKDEANRFRNQDKFEFSFYQKECKIHYAYAKALMEKSDSEINLDEKLVLLRKAKNALLVYGANDERGNKLLRAINPGQAKPADYINVLEFNKYWMTKLKEIIDCRIFYNQPLNLSMKR
jgi:hypothetical protein